MTPDLDLVDDADLDPVVAQAVRRLAVAGFRALWSGRRVTLPELLGHDGAGLAEATEHLRARGRIELSEAGELVAVHGLARRPTPHCIEHDGGAVNTWCALDAIGIPAALALDARARTGCPTCGVELTVALRGGAPDPVPGAVLWYPEVHGGHLVNDFCTGANLFCSLDHLERLSAGGRGEGAVMTVEAVATLGRKAWADVVEEA